ncbi:PDZ domain-containing RING finger protein 4 [Merluccius polli]|uniref:PDZ domain-containing RING finger protein 4 n=1 Tax=Merluccius polli TaxID=89951 RepID=A0AA47NPM7_MERPO|nr:PDZ domain-containing RING finger protein 4 [Merluccius polli]
MGCNLCTLQKREEHYKLLYEIAQVNGRDFSKAGHDEAAVVDALRRDAIRRDPIRRDPIVVQVLRRTPGGAAVATVARNHGDGAVDVCTQTDITFEHIMALAKLRATTPPVPDICPFLLSDSCHSIQTMEHEYYECPEYLSNTPAEVERTEEYEYEEVELCRQNSLEKLGLTLCYRTDDEEDMAIYVSQVEPNSIAARDGRIKEGDRILQINGCEVQDREKAVALLASEDARSILFLVTRPDMQLEEEEWLEEEQGEILQELKMEILEREDSTTREDEHLGDDEVTTDTATYSSTTTQDKDSGLGRGTESPDHHHPALLSRLHRRTTAQRLRDRWRDEQSQRQAPLSPRDAVPRGPSREGKLVMRGSLGGSVGGGGSGGGLLGTENRFQQLLELKCQIRNGGECGVYSIRHSIECSLTEQGGDEGGDGDGVGGLGGGGGGGGEEEEEEEEGGMEQELRLLNEELRSIELECQSIMQAHHLRQSDTSTDPRGLPPPLSPKDLPKRHGRLADIHEHPEVGGGTPSLLRDKDSSSAYNTADSARSTPLGTEGSPDLSLQRRVRLTNQKNLRLASASPPISIPKALKPSIPSQPQQPRPPQRCDQGLVISSSPDQSNPSPSEGSDPALPADDERCEKRGRTRGVQRGLPYASSNQTSPLQSQAGSRQLQSYMQLLQQHSTLGSYSQSQLSQLSLLSLCREPVHHHRHGGSGGGGPRPAEPRLEWKVKVRADGSRYVARRPARDRILRERALRIREERSGGMTTDDDAMSEMKMGRYWSKEERKQQLARAREQRKRREYMQRSRLECLHEGPGSGAEGRKEVSILELSHRKMMKKRNKKILDNWMTIQELMSHGARAPPEGANKQVHNAFLSVTTV